MLSLPYSHIVIFDTIMRTLSSISLVRSPQTPPICVIQRIVRHRKLTPSLHIGCVLLYFIGYKHYTIYGYKLTAIYCRGDIV